MKVRLIAPCALLTAFALTACGGRNEMGSQTNNSSTREQGTSGSRTPLTVTGCFQEASGFDNFVLTNTTGSEASPEQRARGYRIERGGDLEQYIGKQVRVSGWTDSRQTASLQGDRTSGGTATSGETAASGHGGEPRSERMDFNDLPELHVDRVDRVSDNCGNMEAGPQR